MVLPAVRRTACRGYALKCPSGHSFDRAKEGYWHLLPVQNTRTKGPRRQQGDGRCPPRVPGARADYGIFGQALGELCLEYGQPKAGKPLRLLDAGCGEGWYDRCIAKQFEEAGRPLELAGFDIAKPAVRLAAKALPPARYAVASSFHQPVRTGWADVLLNCFSPFAQEEFLRVLRPGGRLIYAVPGAEQSLPMMKGQSSTKSLTRTRCRKWRIQALKPSESGKSPAASRCLPGSWKPSSP